MSIQPNIIVTPGTSQGNAQAIADLARKINRALTQGQVIPPGSITAANLAPGALVGANPRYGRAGAAPTGTTGLLYVRTDDGDGGASTGLWQYEGSAYVRVGPPALHASQHKAGGTDVITAADIGAVGTASPAFTGTPSAPTAAALTNNTQLATTAYTDAAVAVEKARALLAEAGFAPLASPTFTGTPRAPTAAALTGGTQLATAAYADAAVAVEKARAQAAEQTLAVLTADAAAITSQTTLQNATGLGLTIGASATEIWGIEYWLLFTAANATMDVKIGFTFPSGCTMRGGPILGNNSAVAGWQSMDTTAAPTGMPIQTTVQTFGTAAVTQGVALFFTVFGGGTGGTVQLQYAQNVSDPGALQLLKGSRMTAIKYAA